MSFNPGNLQPVILIAIGGAIGALIRYFTIIQLSFTIKHVFPFPVLIINLAGSLMIGFIWGYSEINYTSPDLRKFLMIGVLGAFTTFSTYSNDIVLMIRENKIAYAAIYILAHNILGVLLAFVGMVLAKKIV